MTATEPDPDDLSLTLTLDGEIFALPVAHVSEVVDPLPLTRVPGADPSAPGLVNVRGTIAPFFDLRQRFGMPLTADTRTGRMLVLDLPQGQDRITVVTLADDVDEVIDTPRVDLDAIPAFSVRWPTHLIRGVAKSEKGLITLIDLETTFAPAC